MHEHIARTLYYFQVHLLYASMVGIAAWAISAIPGGSATAKYWIWVATSLNFILPVGAILDKVGAAHLSWAAPLGTVGDAANRISQGPASMVLSVVWLLGAILMLTRLGLRIRADRRDAQATSGESVSNPRLSLLADGVPVRFGEGRRGPAVDGVLRPHISLPNGIEQVLSERELNAVLIHERTHARRRDNLICLIQELGLCALWFHPLVWLTGSRLALYRELSCDESVIQRVHGRDLVSALAKLANSELVNSEETLLLQATASSFLSHRLSHLSAQPQPAFRAASALLIVAFGAVLAAGVFGTVAHTACCFVVRKVPTVTPLPQPVMCKRQMRVLAAAKVDGHSATGGGF